MSISAAPVQQGAVVTGSGITVVGTGTADVVPDVADWSFGVNSQAATASDALSANASAMNAVLDALKSAGVAKEDLQTTEVLLYPQTADDGRTVTGYSASSTVTATVRKLGDSTVGANSASMISSALVTLYFFKEYDTVNFLYLVDRCSRISPAAQTDRIDADIRQWFASCLGIRGHILSYQRTAGYHAMRADLNKLMHCGCTANKCVVITFM